MSNVTFFIRNPIWAFIVPSFFYAAIWLIAPIDFVYSGNFQTLLIAASMPILLLIGALLGLRRLNAKSRIIQINRTNLRHVINLIAFLGFLGLSLRLFERIVLRGGGVVTTDFMANREVLSSGGSGLVSLVGGIFSTLLLLLPFFCLLLKKLDPDKSKKATVFLWLSLLFPLSDIALQGSRSTLIIYLGIFLSSWFTLNQFKFQPRIALAAFISCIALIWIGGAIFILRTTQMGIDPVSSMYLSGYAYFAPASTTVLEFLEHNEIKGAASLVYSLAHLFQYLTHGLYEFFFIISQISSPTTYGLQSFYIPAKIFLTLAGDSDVESMIMQGQLRSGVYTTLFGPLIYDFGPWGAAFFCFSVGVGIGNIVRRISRGHLTLLPIYLVVVGFLPFSMVVNLFASGTGQYALLGSFFMVMVLSMHRFQLAGIRRIPCGER